MIHSLKQLPVSAALCAAISAGPVPAADLSIGYGADITSMDPHFVMLQSNHNLHVHVFDTLVKRDADSKLAPGLAVSWRALDETTWEFRLRRGVKFHDGSDFTADDVAFSLDRPATVLNSQVVSFTKLIAAREVADPYTIRIKTVTPHPMLPNDMAWICIVSRKAAAGAATEDFNTGKAAVGTGPFQLLSYKRGDRVEFARNEAYWGGVPAWNKATFRILTTDAARTAALLSGDVQAIDSAPTADIVRLRSNRDIQVYQKVSHRMVFFHLDQNRDATPFVTDKAGVPLARNPFKDLRVRRAISKAINRDAIRDRVMEGMSVPTANFATSTIYGYVPDLKPEAYDPEGARKLLAEAGYPDGFAMTLHAPNNRFINDDQIAQAVAQMLTRVGIRTMVVALPAASYFPRGAKLEFSFPMQSWGADTEASFPVRFNVATYNPAKGLGAFNWSRYSNPRVDQLLEETVRTIDDDKRLKLLQETIRAAIGDLAVIPIHHQVAVWATRRGVTYTPRTDEYTLAHEFRPQ